MILSSIQRPPNRTEPVDARKRERKGKRLISQIPWTARISKINISASLKSKHEPFKKITYVSTK